MPVFHTKTIESILEPVAQQVGMSYVNAHSRLQYEAVGYESKPFWPSSQSVPDIVSVQHGEVCLTMCFESTSYFFPVNRIQVLLSLTCLFMLLPHLLTLLAHHSHHP